MAQSIILYKHSEAWSLPSLSAASIQVEAYLRFSGQPFHAKACASNSKSPTGQLPSVEKDNEIGGVADASGSSASGTYAAASSAMSSHNGSVLGEFRAAQLSIDFARRRTTDLDQILSLSQKAELLAYRVMIQSRLDVATIWSTWGEPVGYAEVRKVPVMAKLPFPLGYIIPWTHRKEVLKRFSGIDIDEMYSDALAALTALGDRLRVSGGAFFFGSRPSSLDALLAGHLIYYRLCPAAPPILQQKVSNMAVLCDYVDYVMKEFFSTPALPPPPRQPTDGEAPWGAPSWSDAAKGHKSKPVKADLTEAEKLFRRNSRLWLIGAGAAVLAYVLLSGQYIRVADIRNMMADDEEDDEDEDE